MNAPFNHYRDDAQHKRLWRLMLLTLTGLFFPPLALVFGALAARLALEMLRSGTRYAPQAGTVLVLVALEVIAVAGLAWLIVSQNPF